MLTYVMAFMIDGDADVREKGMLFMKTTTKQLTQQVRDALLAFSNKVLMETIVEWLDRADEYFQYADWSDEFRYALGYRVISDTTGVVYANFEELEAAEPDFCAITWAVPDAETLRNILSSFSIEEFYHIVIPLAGYALRDRAYEEKWGYVPSSFSDGYDFMRCLATHLHHKAYHLPEKGHITFFPDAARRRKSMSSPGAATPVFASQVKMGTDNDTLSPRECPSLHSQDLSDQNLDHDH
jgi:hypothetical protein